MHIVSLADPFTMNSVVMKSTQILKLKKKKSCFQILKSCTLPSLHPQGESMEKALKSVHVCDPKKY